MKKTCRASSGRSGWRCAIDTFSLTNQFANRYPETIEGIYPGITGRERFTSNFTLQKNLRDIARPITNAAITVSSKRTDFGLRPRFVQDGGGTSQRRFRTARVTYTPY